MPTGSDRAGRRSINFRASWRAVDVIEQLARDEGVVDEGGEPNRSEMIRILLAYALRNWKRGWRP